MARRPAPEGVAASPSKRLHHRRRRRRRRRQQARVDPRCEQGSGGVGADEQTLAAPEPREAHPVVLAQPGGPFWPVLEAPFEQGQSGRPSRSPAPHAAAGLGAHPQPNAATQGNAARCMSSHTKAPAPRKPCGTWEGHQLQKPRIFRMKNLIFETETFVYFSFRCSARQALELWGGRGCDAAPPAKAHGALPIASFMFARSTSAICVRQGWILLQLLSWTCGCASPQASSLGPAWMSTTKTRDPV